MMDSRQFYEEYGRKYKPRRHRRLDSQLKYLDVHVQYANTSPAEYLNKDGILSPRYK